MKSRISYFKFVSVMVAMVIILSAVALLCSGAALADDGTDYNNADLMAVWIAITFIGATLVNLYWDIFKPKLIAVWAVKEDTFRWKLRGTLIAAVVSIWDTLKAAYKKGLLDGVISVLVAIIKRKLGLPAAARRVGLIKR